MPRHPEIPPIARTFDPPLCSWLALALAWVSLGCWRQAPPPKDAPIRAADAQVVASAALPPLVPNLTHLSAQGGDPRSAIGTNLSEFRDWSAEWSMIDAFKQSRPWISGSTAAWETGAPLDLDARGWVRSLRPGQIARTLLYWGEQPYPEGDYVVLYEGQGELDYFQNTELVSRAPGRDVLRLDPQRGGLGIFIVRTNPRNYLRNIRVLSPGGACAHDPTRWCARDAACGPAGRCLSFEQHHRELLFHPTFLRALTPYSAVRFMNWMATNNSEQERFEDRPLPADARWTTKGVPLEVMVALANRMRLHPWFCMPHRADDAYVRSFATYVRDHLEDGLMAYVEHSNEVWNGLFTQHDYAAQRGALLPGSAGHDRFAQQMRWHALRSREIFTLWEGVYGGAGSRFVRVLGAWADVPYISELLLSSFDVHEVTDALAIAPYFAHDPPASAALDQVFASHLPEQLERARQRMQQTAQVARKHHVALVAYEAGQHLLAADDEDGASPANRLLDAVNRDPRMQGVYERYFDAWREAGGQLLLHYVNVESCGVHGRWGAREHMLQAADEAPKWSAILSWSQRNPRWW